MVPSRPAPSKTPRKHKTMIQAKRRENFVICVLRVLAKGIYVYNICLQRGRFCPEALRAAQYVLRVLLHNTQHTQHVQNANNTRISHRMRRMRSTAL